MHINSENYISTEVTSNNIEWSMFSVLDTCAWNDV